MTEHSNIRYLTFLQFYPTVYSRIDHAMPIASCREAMVINLRLQHMSPLQGYDNSRCIFFYKHHIPDGIDVRRMF